MHTVIIGGGAMGTALANVLAMAHSKTVYLYVRDAQLATAINTTHINWKYFPATPLSSHVVASTNMEHVREAGVVFLAVPSGVVLETVAACSAELHRDAILVNLSKGLAGGITTLVERIAEMSGRRACSLKGPTFATEMVKNIPSAFTLATADPVVRQTIDTLFHNTQVYLDHASDVAAVEYASVLKNIYAIVIGIVDAQMNATNPRFLVMTKAFSEMCRVLTVLTGSDTVANRYCCYGDLGLTALNDMSRNRTLGLLIGKGFFSGVQDSQSVILEGSRALNSIWDHIKTHGRETDFPIMGSLAELMAGRVSVRDFIERVLTSSGS